MVVVEVEEGRGLVTVVVEVDVDVDDTVLDLGVEVDVLLDWVVERVEGRGSLVGVEEPLEAFFLGAMLIDARGGMRIAGFLSGLKG